MNSRRNAVSGHVPRKRFGQHFLHDQRVLDRIAAVAVAGSPPNLLEIGPGLGALTAELLARVPHLVAVELDRDLSAGLANRYPEGQLKLYQMDILRCELDTLERPDPGKPFRVVGNLPYNISTPLIFHLLDQLQLIESMVFMVQKEVALRLTATPGSKAYGRLTVMAALDLDSTILFDVPPEAFDPPPRVESSVIQLLPRRVEDRESDGSGVPRNLVARLVTAAFAQRRKTLRNTLSGMVTAAQFDSVGIDPSLRAEALSPKDYLRLSSVLDSTT